MATYWITFRIADERIGTKSYEDRYTDLTEAITNVSTQTWAETTSFIAFSSTSSIASIASICKKAIAPSRDLFLIRQMDTKSARICGKNNDKTIFTLMPYLVEI